MAAKAHYPDLYGRRTECQTLADRIAQARRGYGGGLAIHGDEGIGKTALLDAAVEMSVDLQVVRLVAAESERRLAYAGIQQLCAPLVGYLGKLPAPQRDALQICLGDRAGG